MANLVSSLPPTFLLQLVYFETRPGRPLISFVNISTRIHNYFTLVEAYCLPASETFNYQVSCYKQERGGTGWPILTKNS